MFKQQFVMSIHFRWARSPAVERLPCKQEVSGSNPDGSTSIILENVPDLRWEKGKILQEWIVLDGLLVEYDEAG